MPVKTEFLHVKTCGNADMIDITSSVETIIYKQQIKEGVVVVSVEGSTASIMNIEYELGLLDDFPQMLEKLAPSDGFYKHDEKWRDGNGHAHLRASMLGNSKTFALYNGEIQIGTWQQIVLVDFDNKPRVRKVIVQILY